MIKEYMEIGVKNDDALIKLATIIQRIESAQAKGDGSEMFDFESLQDLLEESEDVKEEVQDINKENKEE